MREGMSDKAREVWATASRLHFNQDFQLNSQSLAACLTPEPCLGGRAWPTLLLNDPDKRRCEKALLLWANTTLGMISFWWIGTRQQGGRAIVSISRLKDLTVLDPQNLSDDQLTWAELIFDEFKERDLLPANEAYTDPVRQDLDRAVLVDLLGLSEQVLEPLAIVRHQWCSEPTVHGGKSTRPHT